MISYSHPINRLKRSVSRLYYYWSVLPNRKNPKIIRAFWWDRELNFGDLLTEYILPHYGIAPILGAAEDAELVSVGSVLNMIGSDYCGYILGSGVMHKERSIDVSSAKTLALRGKLSKSKLGQKEDIPLGDPGLLMPKVLPLENVQKNGKIGFIPHFTHKDKEYIRNIWNKISDEAVYIDVQQKPEKVVEQIKSCEVVYSTSLHGVILADAYGVPAMWSLPENALPGGDYKFRDYESVVMITPLARKVDVNDVSGAAFIRENSRLADPQLIEHSVRGLEDAIGKLSESLPSATFRKLIYAQFEGPLSRIKFYIKK